MGEDKNRTLEGTPFYTVEKKLSKSVPSGNTLPEESICSIKTGSSYK